MSIQFECKYCDSVLKAGAEKAGQRILCPACSEPIYVPFADDPAVGLVPQSTTSISRKSSENPDQVHLSSATEDALTLEGASDFRAPISVAKIWAHTSQIYSLNLPKCLLASLIDTIVGAVGLFLAVFLALTVAFLVQPPVELGVAAALVIFFLGAIPTFAIIAAGNQRYYLSLCRGATGPRQGLLPPRKTVVSLLMLGFIMWPISILGLFCGFVPGILLISLTWPAAAIVIDQNKNLFYAVGRSFQMTIKRPWRSAVLISMYFCILVASYFLPIAGTLFVLPFAGVFHAVAYLHLNGEGHRIEAMLELAKEQRRKSAPQITPRK
ncbi:hypothetical protein SH668x_002859 [Planctomicrobium sp. SH668]|uniref:hypothetical protein n=1 Tax=Planctomicrobium sp. SH668 TaxID=3448126 RepID=UPI003F5B07C6